MSTYRGYIGTYSKGESKGVYTFTLNQHTFEIEHMKLAAELKDPTFVALDNEKHVLYAVMKQNSEGGIASFKIEPETGSLKSVNQALTADGGPCHVSVNKSGTHALSANYHSGAIIAYSLNGDGTLNDITSTVKHEGNGPNQERQEKAHAHFSGFTPDDRYAVAVDLGTDEVILYTYQKGALEKHFTYQAPPGAGPRHIAFHPHEPYAYVMTELSNEVIVCEYNAALGELFEIQTISTLPEGFIEHSQGSAIHLSEDGRFVYVANRGHDSIASFSVNELSGELSLIEFVDTEGSWPRDFHIDPSGSILVASNQESSSLTVYSRDLKTGKLQLEKANIAVPYPVCVVFSSQPVKG